MASKSPVNKPVGPNGCKVVLVGDGAVGKTSMLVCLKDGKFPKEYIPTVFDNYLMTKKVDGKDIDVALWDTAGQEEYDSIRLLSYPDTSVFMLVFSVESRSSFDNIQVKWLKEVRKHGSGVPIVIVGAKMDLRDNPQTVADQEAKGKPMLQSLEYEKTAKEWGATFYKECSAFTKANLDNVFDEAIRVGRQFEQTKKAAASEGPAGGKEPAAGGGGCCVVA